MEPGMILAAISVKMNPWKLSKNRIWRRRGGGKGMYLTAEAERHRSGIELALRASMSQRKIHRIPGETKIWVKVIVMRPDMRGDPLNCLDLIADAVQRAIGVDDRWYSASVDWELNKQRPGVQVTVLL